MQLLVILYWFCVFCLVYTYVAYPLIIKLLHRYFMPNKLSYESEIELPHISILMAAHNEEKVIEEKIRSVFQNPKLNPKLTLWIGSDNSNDKTNDIIYRLQKEYPQIIFFPFTQRQGKPSIINQLTTKAFADFQDHIFIITDANVLFSEATVFELVKHFKNEKIAIVESNIIGTGIKKEGISTDEKKYVSSEIWYKYYEGLIFKVFSGPMGGCFAIRSNFYSEVPRHFMVDDFFIVMSAIQKGGQGIVEPKAICFEGISHSMKEEVRRKTRIGTGNFQNLFHFKWLWLKFPFTAPSIVFFSHKILRWLGPIFILFSTMILLFLQPNLLIYKLLLVFHFLIIILIPLIYFTLVRLGIHVPIFRIITYFFAANLALFKGMIAFFRGKNSGIWEPTKR